MKLYKLSQHERIDYDTYDSIIVAAENEADAATIHPEEGEEWYDRDTWTLKYGVWATSPKNVKVEFIGIAKPGMKRGVVLGSFNAG